MAWVKEPGHAGVPCVGGGYEL